MLGPKTDASFSVSFATQLCSSSRTMIYKRGKPYTNSVEDFRGILSWTAKLIIVAVTIIGLSFAVFLYSYKTYMDSILKKFASDRIRFAAYLDGLPQNDSRIVEYIRTHHLRYPAVEPYNWSDPSLRPGYNAVNTQVRKTLGKLDNGFFVEARARDGVTYSNTRVLEVNHGWHGVLIEPLPTNLQLLQRKHRKAFIVESCVSIYPFPNIKALPGPVNLSISEPDRSLSWLSYKVHCFPLYSILAAVNVSAVDYLSLDVDGSELDVLKTIPFDSILIKVISVRYAMIPEGADPLRDFLKSKGYLVVGEGNGQYIFKWQSNNNALEGKQDPQTGPDYDESIEINLEGDDEEDDDMIVQVIPKDSVDDDDIQEYDDISIEP